MLHRVCMAIATSASEFPSWEETINISMSHCFTGISPKHLHILLNSSFNNFHNIRGLTFNFQFIQHHLFSINLILFSSLVSRQLTVSSFLFLSTSSILILVAKEDFVSICATNWIARVPTPESVPFQSLLEFLKVYKRNRVNLKMRHSIEGINVQILFSH